MVPRRRINMSARFKTRAFEQVTQKTGLFGQHPCARQLLGAKQAPLLCSISIAICKRGVWWRCRVTYCILKARKPRFAKLEPPRARELPSGNGGGGNGGAEKLQANVA